MVKTLVILIFLFSFLPSSLSLSLSIYFCLSLSLSLSLSFLFHSITLSLSLYLSLSLSSFSTLSLSLSLFHSTYLECLHWIPPLPALSFSLYGDLLIHPMLVALSCPYCTTFCQINMGKIKVFSIFYEIFDRVWESFFLVKIDENKFFLSSLQFRFFFTSHFYTFCITSTS